MSSEIGMADKEQAMLKKLKQTELNSLFSSFAKHLI